MTKEIIENQLRKYAQNYHITLEDKPLLQKLKRHHHHDEVDLSLCSEDFFNFLLYESDLDDAIKVSITQKFFELISNKKVKIIDDNASITSIDKLMLFYELNLENLEYNFDCNYYGKTIPIYATFELIPATRGNPRLVNISYTLNFCNLYKIETKHTIYHSAIVLSKEKTKQVNFYSLLANFNIFQQNTAVIIFKKKIDETNLLKAQNGLQLKTNKNGINFYRKYNRSNESGQDLSKNGEYSEVIIESTLEFDNDSGLNADEIVAHNTLPYLRVFSLIHKNYFIIHIDDLEPYEYDKNAISKLIISKKVKIVLNKIFQSNAYDHYGDFIKNKHGGLVILAEGPPGVGKTSTAEVYAALQEKPLYIVQIKELGTIAESIEKNLKIIFARVQQWKAVLLFDEIDIFLFKRQQDLQQSAIVGVFLRLLDYFTGLIFFTTNRSEVLDPAILSRISLKIKYDLLDENAQKQIWKSKILDAGLTIDSLNLLSKMNLNGREIKNAIRISKIIYGENLKEVEVKELLDDFM